MQLVELAFKLFLQADSLHINFFRLLVDFVIYCNEVIFAYFAKLQTVFLDQVENSFKRLVHHAEILVNFLESYLYFGATRLHFFCSDFDGQVIHFEILQILDKLGQGTPRLGHVVRLMLTHCCHYLAINGVLLHRQRHIEGLTEN